MTANADSAQERQEFLRNAALRNTLLVAEAYQGTPFSGEGSRICVGCGKEISKERLGANPKAIRCCLCQDEFVAKHPMLLAKEKR